VNGQEDTTMLLKYFYDKSLAQASYMVGCQAAGEALVIDPARHVAPYLEAAAAENLRITYVAETHIHADFVSGSRELAAATGATLILSAEGGPDWQYDFTGNNIHPLHDGDRFEVGKVRIDVMHTPGHTPEHLVFLLTDTAAADKPMGLFGGDCLFVGDVGRPDLLETAAKIANTKEQGARQQFANVQRLKALPDYLQVWPGHGAGSACGKALGSVPSSTLGYEKLFNPAFQFDDEEAFVAWLLDDQPETPKYFGQMKRVNKHGPALLSELEPIQQLEGFILLQAVKNGALVIDTRPLVDFQAAHVPGTLNIAPSDKFSSYAGEFIQYDQPTYLIAEPEDVDYLTRELRAIGVDDLPGFFPPREMGKTLVTLDTIVREELAKKLDDVFLLDVRGKSEWRDGHIPGAYHIPLGQVADRLDEIPRDKPVVVQCGSGLRSQIIASLLQKHGYGKVRNLVGGFEGWEKAGLPVSND
jgi:hydroxyacylglutathione hydrolase